MQVPKASGGPYVIRRVGENGPDIRAAGHELKRCEKDAVIEVPEATIRLPELPVVAEVEEPRDRPPRSDWYMFEPGDLNVRRSERIRLRRDR